MIFNVSSKILIIIIALISSQLSAESFIVPSEFSPERVIVIADVNDSRQLRLILDTGMGFDGVYLFNKSMADKLDMTNAVEARVPGFGTGEPSRALMIYDGCLKLGEMQVDSQRALVSLSEHTQNFNTDGVVGGNLFGHYVVEIDYDNEQVVLHEPSSFNPDSGWIKLPLTFKKNLPVFECNLEVISDEIITTKLNIDLGYKGGIELVVKPDRKFSLPKKLDSAHIGTGLSGDVFGLIGKCRSIDLAGFKLNNITTTFATQKSWAGVHDVTGIVGNNFMRRFNAIYDYESKILYLRPSKFFTTPFN